MRMTTVRTVISTTSTMSSVRVRALASHTTARPEDGAISETLSGWTTRLRLSNMAKTNTADQPTQRMPEGRLEPSVSPHPTGLSIVGWGAIVQENGGPETMES